MLLGSSYLNKYTINRIALGYANFLLNDSSFKNRGILISHDTRKNSIEFSEYFLNVLKSKGIKVFLFKDNSPEPTPIHSYLINKKKLSGGIMITASHNPEDYNGIKIYDQTGCQLLPDKANFLTLEINKIENYFDIVEKKISPDKFYDWEKVFTDYLKSIKKEIVYKDLSNVNVIFSSLHGTSYKYIKKLSKIYKFNLISVDKENYYDQNFKNAKSINPVEEAAYFNSLKLAKNSNAELIALTDPDADRIGVMVKDKNAWHFLNGNELAEIQFFFKLKNIKKIKNSNYLAYSYVSTTLPKLIAEKNNLKIIETQTGFKWIGEQINNHKTSDYVFGFEESFGSLLKPISRDKDAIMSFINIIDIASYCKKNNMTLIDLQDKIYKKYGYNKTITFALELKNKDQIKIITKGLEKTFSNQIIKDFNNEVGPLKSNMLKIYFADKSWIALRPSGTEPLIRVYLQVFNNDKTLVDKKIKKLKLQLNKVFNQKS